MSSQQKLLEKTKASSMDLEHMIYEMETSLGKAPSKSPFDELYAKYDVSATAVAEKSEAATGDNVEEEKLPPAKEKKQVPVPGGSQQAKKGKKQKKLSDEAEPVGDGVAEEPGAERQKVEQKSGEMKTEKRVERGKPIKYVKQQPIMVDGSMLEGGGQLFRMSIALSYLLKRPIQISKIRANRPRGGGLSNQHLTGLDAVVKMVPGCQVTGNKKKSQVVQFNPKEGSIKRKAYEADCGSPGASGLILQMLVPCLLYQEEKECALTILGGTHVGMSPTVFAVQHVLIPTLKMMGVNMDLTVEKHGYFPDVVGKLTATVGSLSEEPNTLQAISLLERGADALTKIVIYVKPSGAASQEYYQETFKPQLIKTLVKMGKIKKNQLEFVEEDIDENIPKQSKAQTLSVSAVLTYPNHTLLHCSALVESNKELYHPQKDYAEELAMNIIALAQQNEVVVDEHFTDQLLVYMVLAVGKSQMRVQKPLSLHTQTMLVLLPMFREDLNIEVEEQAESVVVTIQGLGISNE